MAGRFSVEAVFKAIDRVTAPVTRMQNRVGKFTRSARRGFNKLNRSVDKFSAGIKRGALATVAALALTTGAMANVIGTGAEFEQTLVSAAAKFPGEIRKGTAAFQQLEEAARKTGATTEFTASQSAAALNFLAMAGFNAESSIAALPGVVDLATASSIDLATATDVASDSLGAFGLMTKDATKLGANLARINDVIAKTTTSANTTVESLFETIRDGAPVATSAGASLETFAALAGELANSGIKGSKAGTTLKNMFLSLAAPGSGAAKILRRLGVVTKDSNGDMRDIVDILGDLGESLGGLGTADRAGVLEGIFGKIPIAGVNILLKSGSERLREYRKELENASGASKLMATVMRDTVQGRLNSLKSAIEGVKISIFSLNSGPLSEVIDKMTNWVRVNEDLIASNIGGFMASLISNFEGIVKAGVQVLQIIALYVALVVALKLAVAATVVLKVASFALSAVMATGRIALIAYTAVTTALPKALALARVAMLALNLAFSANPVGLIIKAITAFIALAGAIFLAWDPVKQFFIDLWGDITSIFDSSIKNIVGVLDKVRGAASFISGAGSKVAGLFGIGDSEESTAGTSSQVVSPQERVARSIDEQRTTSAAEVTIRDDTGRAEVTGGNLGQGITLQPSGAF